MGVSVQHLRTKDKTVVISVINIHILQVIPNRYSPRHGESKGILGRTHVQHMLKPQLVCIMYVTHGQTIM